MCEPQPYILIVDDDEDDLEMVSSELKMKGIRVKTFESPTKALFYLTLMSGNKELPSLIILDYNMPARNGQHVLLSIKGNLDTKDIPVVMYSTGISDVLKIQLMKAGALNCFDKPWNSGELVNQVRIFEELTYSFANKELA